MLSDANLLGYVAILLLAMYSLATRIAPYHDLTEAGCRVGYVYDGDTVELICGNDVETARLVGFDTPETKDPRCPAELALGKRATERLRQLVKGQPTLTMTRMGRDKYGRVLVRMEAQGRNIGDILIDDKLAVAYRGGTRIDWCARIGG